MARKIKTTEIQLSGNVATQSDVVVLAANLSDAERQELKAQGGRVEFWVGDDRVAEGIDLQSFDWRPKVTGTPLGAHTASVRLVVNDQPIATGETSIYLVETIALEVSADPSEADEGESNRPRCGEAINTKELSTNCLDQARRDDLAEGRSPLQMGCRQQRGGRTDCSPYRRLANGRHERRRASSHGNAGRSRRAGAADRRRSCGCDRAGENQAFGSGQGRHATRSLAALGHGANPRPGILVADTELHRRDQRQQLLRLHRARALPRADRRHRPPTGAHQSIEPQGERTAAIHLRRRRVRAVEDRYADIPVAGVRRLPRRHQGYRS